MREGGEGRDEEMEGGKEGGKSSFITPGEY